MGVIVSEEYPHISVVTLNRPEKRNALNQDILEQLCEAIEQASHRPDQRVLILRGEGDVFCSGMDLKEARNTDTTTLVMKLLKIIYESHLVTIAAVHGSAMAAGAGITAACDLVMATDNCLFGFPETSRGIVPAIVMCFLVRQLPYRTIREMLLLAEAFDSQRALAYGFVNRVVSPNDLMAETLKAAQVVLTRGPESLISTKKLLASLYPRKLDDDIKNALNALQASVNSQEAQEGIAAFLEKREPNWKK